MNIRRKLIISRVEQILAEHNICEAPIDVVSIARSFGVAIREEPNDDDSLSGFLYRDHRSNTAVIGVNKKHSLTRRRFTTAHELGHLLLHAFTDVHVDKAFGQLKLRDETSSTGTDPEEVEANLFAAELLMPRKLLAKELESHQMLDVFDERGYEKAIKAISAKFQVSPQALNIRLVQLGFVHVS